MKPWMNTTLVPGFAARGPISDNRPAERAWTSSSWTIAVIDASRREIHVRLNPHPRPALIVALRPLTSRETGPWSGYGSSTVRPAEE
jgi:hypothetical protein